jgi:hypothetical protein
VLLLLLACLVCGRAVGAYPASHGVALESFEDYPQLTFPHRWKARGEQHDAEKIYRIKEQDGNRFLHAWAEDKAIQLGLPYAFAPQTFARLRWRWRVTQLPRGGDERRAETYDSAAAVYVVFGSPLLPRILKYVWSASVPVGTQVQNPFYRRATVIVLQSGDMALGQWREETVNFATDYCRVFGAAPEQVLGIGLMTNADSTKSSAEADYDDFLLLPEGN